MGFYNGKNVLVTGGTGMIGVPLVKRLCSLGSHVRVASLDESPDLPDGVSFVRTDLRHFENCLSACEDMDIVFHLAGIKGSPDMTKKRPASFFVPTIQFSVNMMEAARQKNVLHYLFTSSVGVYSPANVFFEDDVWKTFPSEHDKFSGWAKRICELQASAYMQEHKWNNISIVRPANVYGPYDNFDPKNAMVIPSLIRRVMDGEAPLRVWGDGSAIRDFIYSDDVARGMLHVVEKQINVPVNLGSGDGVSIKRIAELICSCNPNGSVAIEWDKSKPTGDARRLMDISRAKGIGFESSTDIEVGIRNTVEWYLKNLSQTDTRYNAFTESSYLPSQEL